MQILTVGDKTLRRKAKKVANIDDTVRTLCVSLVNTMYQNNGVGLAAPQVGILKSIIVVDVKGEPLVLINPEIVSTSTDKVSMEEGCLSIPGKYKDILRPDRITVKYRDTKGRTHLECYTGLTSRIIQHEVDHLLGVLMVDYEENANV